MKEVKVRDLRPCPSAVLLKYEASCHELLIALTAQECGEGGGSVTVLPPKGLIALPLPLEKMARPIAEVVKWDASHVTDKVDFTKGVKVGIYVCNRYMCIFMYMCMYMYISVQGRKVCVVLIHFISSKA